MAFEKKGYEGPEHLKMLTDVIMDREFPEILAGHRQLIHAKIHNHPLPGAKGGCLKCALM